MKSAAKVGRSSGSRAVLSCAGWVVPLGLGLGAATAQTPLLSNDIHRLLPVDGTVGPGAVGDFDGDGDADLVLGRRLLINDGATIFRPAPLPSPSTPHTATSYAVGDLDHDLDLDLVVGTGHLDEVWLNDGAGGFGGPPRLLLPHVPQDFTNSIALGDVDLDGDLDIVMSNISWEDCDDDCHPGNQRLFLNDGAANFTDASARIPFQPDSFPGAVALGDVDGDGDLDILVANVYAPLLDAPHRLLLNEGDGNFMEAVGQVPYGLAADQTRLSAQLADFDGDGDLDALIGSTVLWRNDGHGWFSDASANLPPHSGDSRAAVGDIDADGDLDVLACSILGDDSLLLNRGDGTFARGGPVPRAGESTYRALLGDFDVDGDPDAVLVRQSYSELAFNEAGARFVGTPPLIPWWEIPRNHGIAVGDVDGNHLPDVLLACEGGDRLWLNVGDGSFFDGTSNLPPLDDSTRAVALVDIDRDGDLDGLFANDNGYVVTPDHVCLNDGSGRFTLAPGLWSAPLDDTAAMATADVDGDGDIDVLTASWQAAPGRLYFNDGTGRLAEMPGKWPAGAGLANCATFSDVDGDGDMDAVLGEDGAKLFENDGTGGFTEVPGAFSPVNSTTWALALGDVDGDGDPDCVLTSHWLSPPARTVRLFVNSGAGSFAEDLGRLPGLDDFTPAVTLADFDEDGDLDLACSSEPARLLLNDGQGYFVDAPGGEPAIGSSYAMAACDTDGDRDLDLVCGQSSAHAHVLVNTTRQLAWRTLPRTGAEQVLDLYGPSAAAYRLIGAEWTRWIPIEPFGVVRVARRLQFASLSGVLDAQGRAQATWPVPLHAQLIGRSLYWQAWFSGPPRLSNLEVTTFLGP